MWVEVRRSGGFGGLERRWRACGADAEDPTGLIRLVEACPWAESSHPTSPDGADRFSYRFSAGGRTATVPESALNGPWRALFQRVRDLSRTVE